jgi:hypothetical protein
MATYKGIQGYSVQTLASDPSPTASVEGQLWFNSTSSTYKIAMSGAGVWASGGALNNARDYLGGGAGIQTAGMVAGGRISTSSDFTETYDGSAWTEVADLNQNKAGGGCFGSVNTAAIYAGGYVTPPGVYTTNSETWNGTSWTETNNINSGRSDGMGGSGTTTSGLIYGGYPITANCETYDGTSWTETANLNTARMDGAGSGVSNTSAIYYGAETEVWNGTSWTEVNDLNSPRNRPSGTGTATAALAAGGDPPASALVEQWDGSSWTEVADLATARGGVGWPGAGTTSLTFVAGGNPPPTKSNLTEEWTNPSYSVKTVTVS